MYDRETGSLWSHVTGECIQGPLKGERLEALPAEIVPFEEWSRNHPLGLVLARPPGSDARSRYEEYARSERQGIFGTQARRSELPPKSIVQGVQDGSLAAAIPHSALREGQVNRFTLGGSSYRARRERGAIRVRRHKGEQDWVEWPSTSAYWFAWTSFFPSTKIVR